MSKEEFRVKTLHVYRHPPIANPAGLCYGRYDIPLAKDWQQAVAKTRPSGDPRSPCLSSPASRALTYAQWLWPQRPICIEPRLQELDFGAWEGRPWSAIAPSQVDHWQQDLWRHSAPGGESIQQMSARLDRLLIELSLTSAHAPELCLVSHHGVLKLLIGKARQLSVTELLDVSVPFGARVSFRLTGSTLRPL